MDYNKTPPQGEDDTPEAREPAVAYGTAATTEADRLAASILGRPEGGDEDEDADFWDEEDRICRSLPTDPHGREWRNLNADDDPEFRAAVLRRADEAIARMEAGEEGYTTEEVFEELEWCIKHDQWDDVIERMKKEGRYGRI
jgi:hypothetical protein